MLLFLISQKGLFNIIGVMRYVLVLLKKKKKYLKTVCFVRFCWVNQHQDYVKIGGNITVRVIKFSAFIR